MSELVAMFFMFAVLGVYGGYKYFKASDNDYNTFVVKANSLEAQVNSLEAEIRRGTTASNNDGINIQGLQGKVSRLESEQLELKERLIKKRPVIQLRNPIPVTIVEHNKKVRPTTVKAMEK